jgi:hypothetical protein
MSKTVFIAPIIGAVAMIMRASSIVPNTVMQNQVSVTHRELQQVTLTVSAVQQVTPMTPTTTTATTIQETHIENVIQTTTNKP